MTQGSISLSFSMDYPYAEPLTDRFTYEDTAMTMELSPWCAVFRWNMTEPSPSFADIYVRANADASMVECGYVKLMDGTFVGDQGKSTWKSMGYGGILEEQGKVNLNIQFTSPVDPTQVSEIYLQDGTCIWTKTADAS